MNSVIHVFVAVINGRAYRVNTLTDKPVTIEQDLNIMGMWN